MGSPIWADFVTFSNGPFENAIYFSIQTVVMGIAVHHKISIDCGQILREGFDVRVGTRAAERDGDTGEWSCVASPIMSYQTYNPVTHSDPAPYSSSESESSRG